MGYRSLAINSTRKAFSLLKDLTEDVVLSSKTASGFDFGSGAAVLSAASTSYIKAIIVTEKQDKNPSKAGAQASASGSSLRVMFKAADVADLSVYDTVTTRDGRIWKMVAPFSNDGYVSTATLSESV